MSLILTISLFAIMMVASIYSALTHEDEGEPDMRNWMI